MSFASAGGFLGREAFVLGGSHVVWPTFAASVAIVSADQYAQSNVTKVFGGVAQCDASAYKGRGQDLKYEGYPYCPRVRTFGEVFTNRNISWIVGKNIVINVMIDITPYISEVTQELQDADNENREPVLPPMPSLYPSLKKGLVGSVRQATVTLVRWLMDWWVSVNCVADTAFKLLRDYNTEIQRILTEVPSKFNQVGPVYMGMLRGNYTWTAAEFLVSMLLAARQSLYEKTWNLRRDYLLRQAKYNALRCGVVLLVDPIGAVVGGIVTSSSMGAYIGFNIMDLILLSGVESLAQMLL